MAGDINTVGGKFWTDLGGVPERFVAANMNRLRPGGFVYQTPGVPLSVTATPKLWQPGGIDSEFSGNTIILPASSVVYVYLDSALVGAAQLKQSAAVPTGPVFICARVTTDATSIVSVAQLLIDLASAAGEVNIGSNVGAGPGLVFRDKIGVVNNFRTLNANPVPATNPITVSTSGDEVLIESSAVASIVDALLPGESLLKSGGPLSVLKRLIAGTNITLTPTADGVQIDSFAGLPIIVSSTSGAISITSSILFVPSGLAINVGALPAGRYLLLYVANGGRWSGGGPGLRALNTVLMKRFAGPPTTFVQIIESLAGDEKRPSTIGSSEPIVGIADTTLSGAEDLELWFASNNGVMSVFLDRVTMVAMRVAP